MDDQVVTIKVKHFLKCCKHRKFSYYGPPDENGNDTEIYTCNWCRGSVYLCDMDHCPLIERDE